MNFLNELLQNNFLLDHDKKHQKNIFKHLLVLLFLGLKDISVILVYLCLKVTFKNFKNLTLSLKKNVCDRVVLVV